MSAILQGTTPGLKIIINTDDFVISDETKLELTFKNGSNTVIKELSDVALDTEDNSLTYAFTEAETLTVTSSASSRSYSPGAFYSGPYELICCY